MTRNLILVVAGTLVLGGCALPLVSTEFDSRKVAKYKRTGTNFPATTDLPRNWNETDLKYMDKESSEDLVRRQHGLPGGG